MDLPSLKSGDKVTVKLSLSLPGRDLEAAVSLPAQPVRLTAILPILQALTDAVVDSAVRTAASNNRQVTCHKGCGTCCRVLVRLSEAEAYYLRRVVEALPAERQAAVRARFGQVRERLIEAGLWPRLIDPPRLSPDTPCELSSAYWDLHLACPFLEDEACSIYAARPIRCREVIAVSPPAYCNPDNDETVEYVDLPGYLSTAVCQPDLDASGSVNWVPLVAALDWTDAHPDTTPPRPAWEMLGDILKAMAGAPQAPASAGASS